MRVVSFIMLFVFSGVLGSYPNYYKSLGNIAQVTITDQPGVPLILTPLIEQNKIKQAQAASKVNFNGFKNVTSYSGYFTVDKTFNSNLFFWFFPAANDYRHAPVILWQEGGPGATSLIGLFIENGPFILQNNSLKLRKFSWIQSHSVIYVDGPAGTGYSFTNGGYAQNETKVGADLYNFVIQFFKLFPELQNNDFFISGESYAGKYIPALGYTIHKNNPTAKIKINLKGLTIGNGFVDPEHQCKYGDLLYYIGLIDDSARKTFHEYEKQGITYIKNKQYIKAYEIFDDLMSGSLKNQSSFVKNVTGFDSYYNYLYTTDPATDAFLLMLSFVQRPDVRAAIHVGNTTFEALSATVESNLRNDTLQSVAPWLSELLSYYPVLIYTGQLDIVVSYSSTINYLQRLKFNGDAEYKTAQRSQWYVGKSLAGYVKKAGNLTEVLVRNAGHMALMDQPEWCLDLITRFMRNQPLLNNST